MNVFKQTSKIPIIRPADFMIIIFLTGGFFWIILGHKPPNEPEVVEIHRDRALVARYPLDIDTTITVNGIIGPLVCKIYSGQLRVIQSSCGEHVCEQMGPIGKPGRSIVCAPNHLVISISTKGNKLDAIGQ